MVALASGVLTAAPAAPLRPGPTILTGKVFDPVTGAALAGATVSVENVSSTTAADGSFRVEFRGGRKAHLTAVSAGGYLPYTTWTPSRVETQRDFMLFPAVPVSIRGYSSPVPAELLREHFNVVYRDRVPTPFSRTQGLTRWTSQPNIVLIDHVMETVTVDGVRRWRATEPVGSLIRRRVRETVQKYTAPLTGGFLSGEKLTIRKMQPGQELVVDFWTLAPRGEIVFYAQASIQGQNGGYGILEGETIVSGAAYLDVNTIRGQSAFKTWVITHEFAHTLGMDHPDIVPLCSIMRTNCDASSHATAVDQITGRLAYSRLPGNDRDDRDPLPANGAAARSATHVQWFDGQAIM
jgi:hypothetical protein